jgi:hypothetical protein
VGHAVRQTERPLSVLIDSLAYDERANEYALTLSIAWPDEINQLHINVEEAEGGKLIFTFPLSVNARHALATTFTGAQLRSGREYLVTVQGVDFNGVRMLKPEENGQESTAERVILASRAFQHEPPTATGLPVRIASVNVEHAAQRMLIMLDLKNADLERLEQYEGYVKNKETGAQVYTIDRKLFRGLPLIEPLPPALQNATETQTYELLLTLVTSDDLVSTNEEPFVFAPPPPARPTRWQRFMQTLQTPWLWGGILAIVAGTSTWLILQNARDKERDPLPPPVDQTNRYQPVIERSQQLRVRVTLVATPDQHFTLDETFADFPVTIGREGCTINIPGDRQISRQHLRIDRHQGKVALVDLESANGTTIANAMLVPKKPWPIQSAADVKLGRHTEIRIEVFR